MTSSLPTTSASTVTGPTRRDFVKLSAIALAASASTASGKEHGAPLDEDRYGVLVDLTLCVGCRRCEWACSEANANPHGPLHDYDDQSVFEQTRRPGVRQFTVVNRASNQAGDRTVHLKIQCNHCEKPACVSACLVGAMQKDPHGPVFYDASKCIGCRYCMVACPFDRLAYEYDKKLTPRVRKCDLCRERTRLGRRPACVEMCPVEALLFGTRSELLEVAHERIGNHPDQYVDHVYGETESGGTSWLYLSSVPFDELGLPTLGPKSPAQTTEAIQHGIFAGFAAPIGLATLLASLNFLTGRKNRGSAHT